MKTTFKILAVLVAMVGFSAASYAQSNASATIITPISIAVVDHMNFGNVAASGSLGTVVLTTAGARSVTGGVSLPTTTGTMLLGKATKFFKGKTGKSFGSIFLYKFSIFFTVKNYLIDFLYKMILIYKKIKIHLWIKCKIPDKVKFKEI